MKSSSQDLWYDKKKKNSEFLYKRKDPNISTYLHNDSSQYGPAPGQWPSFKKGQLIWKWFRGFRGKSRLSQSVWTLTGQNTGYFMLCSPFLYSNNCSKFSEVFLRCMRDTYLKHSGPCLTPTETTLLWQPSVWRVLNPKRNANIQLESI